MTLTNANTAMNYSIPRASLITLFQDLGVVIQQGGHWVIDSRYAGLQLTTTRTFDNVDTAVDAIVTAYQGTMVAKSAAA